MFHEANDANAIVIKEMNPARRKYFFESIKPILSTLEPISKQGYEKVDWKLVHSLVALLNSLGNQYLKNEFIEPICRLIHPILEDPKLFFAATEPFYQQNRGLWIDLLSLASLRTAPSLPYLQKHWEYLSCDQKSLEHTNLNTFLCIAGEHQPNFFSNDFISTFWNLSVSRNTDLRSIRAHFYCVGCHLEDSQLGRQQLDSIFENILHTPRELLNSTKIEGFSLFEVLEGMFREKTRKAEIASLRARILDETYSEI